MAGTRGHKGEDEGLPDVISPLRVRTGWGAGERQREAARGDGDEQARLQLFPMNKNLGSPPWDHGAKLGMQPGQKPEKPWSPHRPPTLLPGPLAPR